MSYTLDISHKSPNHSSRNGADISMIVWHATAGSYFSALRELCDPKPTRPEDRVSAHYLIRKDGHIAWLVDDSRAAWHAGVSAWLGLNSKQIQERSIGIELENANDGHDPYPAAQLNAARALGRDLTQHYQIERPMVARHSDIAPRRKSDPLGLPWPAFRDSLYTTSQRYRAVTCAPVFQDRRPDAPLALAVTAGTIEPVDDLTNGWLHLSSGSGFSPVSCWELIV